MMNLTAPLKLLFCATALPALLLTLAAAPAAAEDITDYYTIEDIETPKRTQSKVDGLAFMPDGRLAACFHNGDVHIYDPDTGEWSHFAEGLHEPMGLHAEDNDTLVVMQRPELTRLRDTDGDGWADVYETISDDFGMSGNYHEFAYGPALGPDGNYWISLNTASNGAGIFDELRGEFRERGRPGRMYSCVPYRGWVLRISPDGETTPWAPGFRSPNGVGFDCQGRLFVSDNQGDWLGTSKLFHVEKDKFYGHVSSLVWKPGFEGNPLKTPLPKLDEMRTKPAIQFPHGKLANSPTKPLCESTGGKFGPFAGQLLVGEMNHPRIMRVMIEEVAGKVQGAATSLVEGHNLNRGINRLAFAPDGALWVGQTKRRRGWTGATGIQRITWNGKVPMEVHQMHLTDNGFELTFTKPVDPATASDPGAYDFTHYYYEYHRSYGSKQHDVQTVPVKGVEIGSDRKTVTLTLGEMKAGYVYELNLKGVKAQDGSPVINRDVYYSAMRLPDGTSTTPQFKPIPPDPPVSYKKLEDGIAEAEAAQRIRVAKHANNNKGFTGDGYIDFQSPNRDVLQWKIEDVPAGSYRLSFRYAMGGPARPLKLTVNDETISKSFAMPDSGGWENWKTRSVPVTLKDGTNTIRLDAIGDSGPNVDHVQLIPQN